MAENITRPSYEKVESKVEVMDTPYDHWISSQGIDVIRGFFVEDLYSRFVYLLLVWLTDNRNNSAVP